MNKTKKTVENFRADLEVAAAKEGINLSGLTFHWTTLERTWGDLCGWVFCGEHAERAANFAKAWADKWLAPRRNYDAQYAPAAPKACDYAKDNVGNIFTNRSLVWGGEGLDWKPAFRVDVVYYPCAD